MDDFIVNSEDGYDPLGGCDSSDMDEFRGKKYTFKEFSSEESDMEASFNEI